MRLLTLLLLLPVLCSAQYHITTSQIDSNIYLYTSYGDAGSYTNVDANAVIVVSGKDALLFDTPWDSLQAEKLITYVKDSLKKNILLAIVTHAHLDRIGSIDVMHQHDIPTYAYYLTGQEAQKRGYTIPQHLFYQTDTTLRCGTIDITALYPGPGHTVDNIVLYVPSKHLLYGGCFLKSGKSNHIGNIEDADVAQWPHSVERLQEHIKMLKIKYVIPGHGPWQSDNAINNTLRLLKQEAKGNY